MKHLTRPIIGIVSAALIGFSTQGVDAASVPTLPAGYENFSTNVDYGSAIGGAASGTTNMNCIVMSSNAQSFPAGSTFNPANIQSQPLTVGAAFLGTLNNPSQEVVASCDVPVSIPAGLKTLSGSVSNPALQQMGLSEIGQVKLGCDFQGSFVASAQVRFGGAVPGKFDVIVTEADSEIPFNCSLSVSFGTSSLNGTVKGSAQVADTGDPQVCDGLSTISCVPIQLTDAAVVITSSTGKFGGLTGSGTYSFAESFSLKFIDDQMAGNPFVTISASSVRRGLVGAQSVGAQSGALQNLVIRLSSKKKSGTSILRPIGTTIAVGEGIYVTGTAKASCVLTAKVASKSTRISSFTLSSIGQAQPRTLSAKVVKAIGAKKGSVITLTASCKGTDKKTTVGTKRVKYSG